MIKDENYEQDFEYFEEPYIETEQEACRRLWGFKHDPIWW